MNESGRTAGPDAAAGGEAMPPPAPPWHCRLDAIVWWHRAGPGAVAALPDELRAARRLPVTLAALIRYAATPVGAYGELTGCPLLLLDGGRLAGHVPFMAVDSAASADAGRTMWALPKVMAAFDWPDGALATERTEAMVRHCHGGRSTGTRAEATVRHGAGEWSVAVRVRPRRARIPFAAAGRCLQVDDDGHRVAFPARGIGLAAPARARVAVNGSGAPAWLADGDHPAFVLSRTRLRVGRTA